MTGLAKVAAWAAPGAVTSASTAITSAPRRRSVVIGVEAWQIGAHDLAHGAVAWTDAPRRDREAQAHDRGAGFCLTRVLGSRSARAPGRAAAPRRRGGRRPHRRGRRAAPARALGALLDRRGDLGRDLVAPAERDSGRPAPGRLPAAVLPAPARVDGALRFGPAGDARAVRGAGHRLRAGRLVGGGAHWGVG